MVFELFSLVINQCNTLLFRTCIQLICLLDLTQTCHIFVPKSKLNVSKSAFSVAALTIWNQLPITIKSSETIAISCKKPKNICSKLPFHHTFLVVFCSSDNSCLSPFLVMCNGFICYASELDFSRISRHYRYVTITIATVI